LLATLARKTIEGARVARINYLLAKQFGALRHASLAIPSLCVNFFFVFWFLYFWFGFGCNFGLGVELWHGFGKVVVG